MGMEKKAALTSIGVVVCYMGKLPEWFPLWVRSCCENATIDFLLYTDQELEGLPDNIITHRMTLNRLQKRFSQILGFACSLEAPYKLCDYKVLYGEAFQEDLKDYDFWGHCDLDMVFGDLRKFITEDILKSFDRIFEVGHLSLYRNCSRINRLYREEGALFPWHKVFREKNYCGFDEHTGMTRICEINQVRTYRKVVCADIDPHYRAFYMMDEDSVNGEMAVKNYRHQIFVWDQGRTWQICLDESGRLQQREVSYIHFMRKFPVSMETCLTQKRYCITYKEFIPLDRELTPDIVRKYDYAGNCVVHRLEYLFNFLKHGWRAFRKKELRLRIKIRIQRMKTVNRHCMEK